jgi:hypothetical protein
MIRTKKVAGKAKKPVKYVPKKGDVVEIVKSNDFESVVGKIGLISSKRSAILDDWWIDIYDPITGKNLHQDLYFSPKELRPSKIKIVTVELNDNYDAIVIPGATGFMVGCQHIPIKNFNMVADVINGKLPRKPKQVIKKKKPAR